MWFIVDLKAHNSEYGNCKYSYRLTLFRNRLSLIKYFNKNVTLLHQLQMLSYH